MALPASFAIIAKMPNNSRKTFLGNPQSALLIEFLRGLGPNACVSTTSITVGHKGMLEIDFFVPPCLSFN